MGNAAAPVVANDRGLPSRADGRRNPIAANARPLESQPRPIPLDQVAPLPHNGRTIRRSVNVAGHALEANRRFTIWSRDVKAPAGLAQSVADHAPKELGAPSGPEHPLVGPVGQGPSFGVASLNQ
ncbi:hypothetical protein GCM10010411_55120 [Actinomadura fulvescens]|uniref:Uncharacterized protein n=1 Tax=Actinomadura fulvescens TaxID=46160 RepID=A0ABP6CC12_9ACTN